MTSMRLELPPLGDIDYPPLSPRSDVQPNSSTATVNPLLSYLPFSLNFASKGNVMNAKDQILMEMVEKNNKSFMSSLLKLNSVDDYTRRIHELLVQAQTEEHERPDSLFNFVIQGDLNGIKEKLEYERIYNDGNDIELIAKTDAAGGNIIHAAYLYQKFSIGRWLVENYPHIAILPFSNKCEDLQSKFNILIEEDDMPYTGENILHMAIVRKNIGETRWILDFYKDHKDSVPNGLETLLLGNAVGKFFDRQGDFYCGSYPLHFAACSNDTEMFDLILVYASALGYDLGADRGAKQELPMDVEQKNKFGTNVIFMRDRYGNSCLHLAVHHKLKEMYSHIKETALNLLRKEIRIAYAEQLTAYDADVPSAFGTIPLTPLPEHEGFSHGYCPTESEIIIPAGRLTTEAYNSWLNDTTAKKFEERMELVLNEDLHSPLTLCAAIPKSANEDNERKKTDMIQFLISELKKDRWNYGPIKCSLLLLEGVEFAYYPEKYNVSKPLPLDAEERMHGLIEWICITDSTSSCKITEIQKIITAKWQRFGSSRFRMRFLFHGVVIALVTLLVVLVNSTPENLREINTTATLASSVAYPLTIASMMLTFAYELPSIVYYGRDYLGRNRRVRGAAKFEKVCKFMIITSFITLVSCMYARLQSIKDGEGFSVTDAPGVKVSLSVCAMSVWLYLFYFFMGFDRTGPFVLTIYRIVSQDIPFFLNFYMIVITSFACSIALLTASDNLSVAYGFEHLGLTVFSLIQITVNMQQPGGYNAEVDVNTVAENLIWVFNIAFTIFYVMVVLMFGNLMIAMISSTYGILVEYNNELLLIEKYNIMCAMEPSMIYLKKRNIPSHYSVLVHGKLGHYSNGAGGGDPNSQVPNRVEDVFDEEEGEEEEDERDKNKDDLGETVYAFEMLDEDENWWGGSTVEQSIGIDKMKSKVTLLLIMPQNDFHEEYGVKGTPGYRKGGSLAVPGSNEDSFRIKDVIMKNLDKIDDIIVTMDSHYPTHIAHAIFWRRGKNHPDPFHPNQHPDPFTVISYQDIVEEVWSPSQTDQFLLDWVKYYTKELEKKGRLQLTIWPEHCILGSSGHAVVPPINEALQAWAHHRQKTVRYILKGQNLYTEMYSALVAEVEDPTDPTTGMDWDLLAELKIADKILVCGQALSHCVNFTVRDIVKHWHSDFSKLCLLQDGCSSVKGFENVGKKFLEDMESTGVTVISCNELAL